MSYPSPCCLFATSPQFECWNRLTSRGHYTFDEIIIFSRNLILLWTGFEKVCYWFSDIPLRQRVCIPYTGLFRNVRSVYSLYHAVEVKPVIHLGPVSIEKSHPRVTHLSWASQLFIHFLTKRVERRKKSCLCKKGDPRSRVTLGHPFFRGGITLCPPPPSKPGKFSQGETIRACAGTVGSGEKVIFAKADLAGRVTFFSP